MRRLYWLLHHYYVTEEFSSVLSTADLIEKEGGPDSEAIYYRGLALKAIGRLSDALAVFESGLLNSTDVSEREKFQASVSRCRDLLGLKIFPVPEQKIEYLENSLRESIKTYPSSGVLHSALSGTLWKSPAASLAFAQEAVHLDPLNPFIQRNHALTLKAAGMTASALRAFESAAQLGHPQARTEADELRSIINS